MVHFAPAKVTSHLTVNDCVQSPAMESNHDSNYLSATKMDWIMYIRARLVLRSLKITWIDIQSKFRNVLILENVFDISSPCLQANDPHHLVITRVSEVIMFSPCVFVCLFVCLCLYHDVCPDDLTMKDWCHTNNILQVHCWGCLVVQVMFHALMTSSMTPPGHKVGQILKLTYLRQYSS